MQVIPEELILPPRTIFGAGKSTQLLETAQEFGKRGLLVHGKSLARSNRLEMILSRAPFAMDVASFEHCGGEPSIHDVEAVRQAARVHDADWIAGVGGGSVLDLGKAAAGLSNSDLTVEEHQQGTGLDKPGIPFLAVPSTAGTGSEATIVSVLIDPERKLKKSVRHPSYIPKLVILDPDLLASCPPHIIAGAGMDAFVQGIESYSSRSATWLSKQLSAKSICLLHRSLEKVHQNPDDPAAADLILGSYLAGLALSMARLGVIHGLVHPLGVRYGLPHGLLCGITLPAALKLNRQAMGAAYSEISELIGEDLLKTAKNLLLALGLDKSPLAGKEISDRENIITETLSSGSTKTNPKKTNRQDVEFLLSELTGR